MKPIAARYPSARQGRDVEWDEALGPFYDAAGVRQLLADHPTLAHRAEERDLAGLLDLPTGSGAIVYPTFQFQDILTLRGIAAVVDVLPATLVSPWTIASWLVSGEADLDGRGPIDILSEGGVDRVLAQARRWADVLR